MLGCFLRAGAVVIDTRETSFAMLLYIYPTAWWKLPLDSPPPTYQFPKQPFSRHFSPPSTLILHLAGLQIKVFLHSVHEVFLRERFQGEHCTHGCYENQHGRWWLASYLNGCCQPRHLCLLCLFCQKQFRRESGERGQWVGGQVRCAGLRRFKSALVWMWVTTHGQATGGKRWSVIRSTSHSHHWVAVMDADTPSCSTSYLPACIPVFGI